MRLQIASDLHHEMAVVSNDASRPLRAEPSADVLVLAGDIHEGTRAVELYGGYPIPVVYVHGNHEAYSQRYPELLSTLAERSRGTAVHFLQERAIVIGGVRFLGACMWTDFGLFPQRVDDSIHAAAERVTDYRRIYRGNGLLQPEDTLAYNRRSSDWLGAQLDKEFDGKTVVVTHHAPSRLSIPNRYHEHPLAPAYASDLTALAAKVELWIHGHVHASSDYTIGPCRVICNPRGYFGPSRTSRASRYQNEKFDPRLVIEI